MRIELPTLALLIGTYLLWAAALWLIAPWSIAGAVILLILCIAQHSSIQHEVIHGHPFGRQTLNEASVWPAIGLVVPFQRFRDTHLAHHQDANLTDPYDDPETNYFDPEIWDKMTTAQKVLMRFNNTLLGRMLVGPIIGTFAFIRYDICNLDAEVRRGWLAHIPAVLLVLALVWLSPMPVWAYLVACYGALSVLKIRTYLEHRAHEKHCARTVLIEDRGLLSLLFLNNNYHVVHHMHPTAPWYKLPALYREKAERFLQVNDEYYYPNYRAIFRKYFLKAKDPVPHPLWRK